MATRQERLSEFTSGGAPQADQPFEVLCEDHVGTYVIPYPCRWTEGAWRNAATGDAIEATIIGWRARGWN
jgi:hypothetical protein